MKTFLLFLELVRNVINTLTHIVLFIALVEFIILLFFYPTDLGCIIGSFLAEVHKYTY